MRVELNIPANKAQDFLAYFKAEAKKQSGGRFPYGDSSAGYDEEGNYVAQLPGYLLYGENKILVHWTIPQTMEGAIPYVEFQVVGGDKAERLADNFIRSVLAAALAEREDTFFQRVHFTHLGSMLDGEYWLPRFRLAPSFADDPDPYFCDAERVNCIDVKVEAIDSEHAWQLATQRAEIYVSRLALLARIGFNSRHSNELVWVNVSERGAVENRRLRRMPKYAPIPTEMPKKNQDCNLGKFEGSIVEDVNYVGNLITLPKETRKILRAVKSDLQFERAFDSCARLFQLSLLIGRYSASASFAYRVAAVDALAQSSSHSGFSEFMRAQVSGEEGLDEFLDLLYSDIRSAHFHGGSKPLDLSPALAGDLLNKGKHQNFMVQIHSDRLLWKAISAWVMSEVVRIENMQS